jgi:hypothetical protein
LAVFDDEATQQIAKLIDYLDVGHPIWLHDAVEHVG